MNKKIISVILAFATLASAASAANLYEYVNGDALIVPFTGITERVNSDGVYEHDTVIKPTVTAQIKKTNARAYSDTVTVNDLTETVDYLVNLDMTKVKEAFTGLCTVTENAIELSTPSSRYPVPTGGPDGSPADPVDISADIAALKNQFYASTISGKFSVNVKFSNKLAVNTNAITLQQGSGTPAIFGNMVVGPVSAVDASTSELTVTFDVTNAPTVSSLKSDTALSQLDDLFVVLSGVSLPSGLSSGEQLTVMAQLTAPSYIELTDSTAPDNSAYANKAYGKLNFASNASAASVTYTPAYIPPTTGGSGGGKRPNTTLPANVPVIKANADGKVTNAPIYANGGKYFLNIDNISIPGKENFAFEGWYTDPYFSNHVSGTIQVDQDMNLYARYINLKAPEQLISEDHMAYISGYPDGTIQPESNITREEVISAFYRLLKPEFKATIETETNSFPDVAADRWSNKAVSTMANGGFIVGDANGNFNPSSPITRAEFVTIANKFLGSDIAVPDMNQFSDISGHWAEKAILAAANGAYWISGYSDGTFRPNNYITRAEAMTIINKMLVRYGDTTANNAKVWPDVSAADWFYSQIIEATTDNLYERMGNGWQEKWISPEAPKTETEPEPAEEDKTDAAPADEGTAEGSEEVTEEVTSEENTEDTTDGNTENTAEGETEEMTEPEK